jgi:hypothetical protein
MWDEVWFEERDGKILAEVSNECGDYKNQAEGDTDFLDKEQIDAMVSHHLFSLQNLLPYHLVSLQNLLKYKDAWLKQEGKI